jgi:hypothetical protein
LITALLAKDPAKATVASTHSYFRDAFARSLSSPFSRLTLSVSRSQYRCASGDLKNRTSSHEFTPPFIGHVTEPTAAVCGPMKEFLRRSHIAEIVH